MKPLIVITGASSGIGKACAQLFSQLNYPLLLLARRILHLQALELPHTLCEQVNVSDRNAFAQALDKAENLYGSIHCLINNAGIMLLGLGHKQNPQEWQSMLDTNIMGVLNGIHLVLNSMIQQKNGTIINISSVAGRKSFPNHSIYCGTKSAIHSITESIRQEIAPHNVRLITIAPGMVDTELSTHITSQTIKQKYQKTLKDIPSGPLNPESIAEVIYFAYQQPQNICVREIVIAPTRQVL